jgi:hypothetical protein
MNARTATLARVIHVPASSFTNELKDPGCWVIRDIAKVDEHDRQNYIPEIIMRNNLILHSIFSATKLASRRWQNATLTTQATPSSARALRLVGVHFGSISSPTIPQVV